MTSTKSLFLCVDCGGSKTSAVIVDANGQLVGRANGGPSNIAYLPVPAFVETIRNTVGEALKTCFEPASVEPVALPLSHNQLSFTAAWFGISGADSSSIIQSILPHLEELLGIPADSGRLIVANDAHLLAAPIRKYQDQGVSGAVTVIGGTGSIVVSFTTEDTKEGTSPKADDLLQLGRVGGWGWILGDEGGGFSVGREAIRQILRREDLHTVLPHPPPESTLVTAVKELFGIQDVMQLLTEVYLPDPASNGMVVQDEERMPRYMAREKRLSSLSPLVFAAAFPTDDQIPADPLALSILHTCAKDLADQISVVVCLNTSASTPATSSSSNVNPRLLNPSTSVLCFGGSLVGIPSYRDLVLDILNKEHGAVFREVEFVDDCARVGAEGLAKRFGDM